MFINKKMFLLLLYIFNFNIYYGSLEKLHCIKKQYTEDLKKIACFKDMIPKKEEALRILLNNPTEEFNNIINFLNSIHNKIIVLKRKNIILNNMYYEGTIPIYYTDSLKNFLDNTKYFFKEKILNSENANSLTYIVDSYRYTLELLYHNDLSNAILEKFNDIYASYNTKTDSVNSFIDQSVDFFNTEFETLFISKYYKNHHYKYLLTILNSIRLHMKNLNINENSDPYINDIKIFLYILNTITKKIHFVNQIEFNSIFDSFFSDIFIDSIFQKSFIITYPDKFIKIYLMIYHFMSSKVIENIEKNNLIDITSNFKYMDYRYQKIKMENRNTENSLAGIFPILEYRYFIKPSFQSIKKKNTARLFNEKLNQIWIKKASRDTFLIIKERAVLNKNVDKIKNQISPLDSLNNREAIKNLLQIINKEGEEEEEINTKNIQLDIKQPLLIEQTCIDRLAKLNLDFYLDNL